MFKKINFLSSLVAGLILLGLFLIIFGVFNSSKKINNFQDHEIVAAKLGQKSLKLEIVNTPTSITEGLSGRENLGEVDGMLFILPEKTLPKFWMKQMKFPIDIIWLENMNVVDLSLNLPIPDSRANLVDLPIYSPKVGVELVLEVPAGKVNDWGISLGDSLEF